MFAILGFLEAPKISVKYGKVKKMEKKTQKALPKG